MKVRKPTTATMAQATTQGDSNQSCSLPMSSITCMAATQITSSARPMESIGSLRRSDSRWRKMPQVTATAAMPTGTLI